MQAYGFPPIITLRDCRATVAGFWREARNLDFFLWGLTNFKSWQPVQRFRATHTHTHLCASRAGPRCGLHWVLDTSACPAMLTHLSAAESLWWSGYLLGSTSWKTILQNKLKNFYILLLEDKNIKSPTDSAAKQPIWILPLLSLRCLIEWVLLSTIWEMLPMSSFTLPCSIYTYAPQVERMEKGYTAPDKRCLQACAVWSCPQNRALRAWPAKRHCRLMAEGWPDYRGWPVLGQRACQERVCDSQCSRWFQVSRLARGQVQWEENLCSGADSPESRWNSLRAEPTAVHRGVVLTLST